jgi:DNA polymerase (family 10)
MENPEVAQLFDEVADLLDIQGANPFRVRAYRNAARTIRDRSDRLAELAAEELEKLDGIGKDLAGKIRTIIETGDLPLRMELAQQVPAGLRDLITIPGLGPKRALILHQRLRIASLDDLRAALEKHKLRKLAGFGEKTEANILKSLQGREESGKRVHLADARIYVEAVLRMLRETPGVAQAEVAGSYRRRKETVGDLDMVVTCKNSGSAMDCLATYESVAEVAARGKTKMTLRLRNGLQLDLRVVPEASFGAALQYFTGSKAHNILLRRIAQDRGLKLNEYGLFRGSRRVAGRTEEEVYKTLDLPWIPPEFREARGEIELAREGRLPHLIELSDLRGDLHMHTTATDGRASLEDMVAAAKRRGHRYIAITDHSKRVTMARGLDARRLRQHWKNIDKLAARTKGITILKGVELDILEDGRLDLPDDVLAEADWVVASIHYGQDQPRERITQRLLGAIRHPHIHAIGHPTGRLIGRRKGQDLDFEAVLKAAAEHGCFLELNSQPDRLDLDDLAVAAAKAHGVGIVIDTDAHSVEELGFLEYGIFQARRGGLEARDVANTRPLVELRKRLKRSGTT